MINMGIVNASSKIESQILIYKQDKEFEILLSCKQSFSLVIVYICVVLV